MAAAMTSSPKISPRPLNGLLLVTIIEARSYQAAADRRIPHIRLGSDDGPVRFLPAEIEQWLENARRDWRPGRQPSIDEQGAS
jgi:predicted DNA-binding transcriptional regulator AlpA